MSDDPAFDALVIVVRRWKALAVFVLLGTAAALAYAFLASQWYEASLSVVPSQRSRDAAMLALATKLPGLDATGGDGQRIEAVLNSTSVADEVIAKFNLAARYNTAHPEDTREALHKHCKTSSDRTSGVITLTCEDHEPKAAMEIAAYFGEVGNRVFARISTSSAHEEEKFLAAQVDKARADVDAASEKLRQFQEAHKVIDLPEQSKAVISAMASIQGDLISKQLELSYLSGFSGRTESNVVQLQQQIAVMQSKLKQLEETHDASGSAATGSGSGAGFFPGAMNVPQLRFELEQLLREQKVQETVFLLVTQRYELAKVEAARDTSTFQILDNPTLPTERSWPKKRKLLTFGVLGGGLFGAAWILVPAWWRRRRSSAPVA